MDAESDDSERWEDFFGSTTELTPSLLRTYDTLTSLLNNETDLVNRKKISNSSSTVDRSNNKLRLVDQESECTNRVGRLFGVAEKVKNQGSDASSKETFAYTSSQNCNNTVNSIYNDEHNICTSPKGYYTPVEFKADNRKHCRDVRFLSSNAHCDITYPDVDAVNITNSQNQFDGMNMLHGCVTKRNYYSVNRSKTQFSYSVPSNINEPLPPVDSDIMDNIDTGTAKSYNFSYNDNELVYRRELASHAGSTATGVDRKTPSSREHNNLDKGIDLELIPQKLKSLPLSDNGSKGINTFNSKLKEVLNQQIFPARSIQNSLVAVSSNGSDSQLFRLVKSLTSKDDTMSILGNNEKKGKMSSERLDRFAELQPNYLAKEPCKMSFLGIPDVVKLKHRPLSSSSICSTSSSSSSSSDHQSSKLNTSYLASVESLADQSENELTDSLKSMTIFERACMEIVDSERNYVNDLEEVIRGYLFDWKERACLRYDELRVLFSNIEEIFAFNLDLLKRLINSGLDPIKISRCFIDLRERFDVYTTYCTSYPEAILLLTKLLQATHTNSLLTSTQKMLKHTLPLGSYLLKPVQRILKYHLLLDNLRKHCDIKEVMQAYEIMRQVARNIDQVKRKLEQQTRVKELSGILDGWLGPELTVLGELRLEGLLMENNKPRKVMLFATMLIITKAKEDNRLQFRNYIHQNNLMLSEHLSGEPTSFYVIPYDEPRNQIKLTAKNREQKRLWTQHIKGVILEKFDNIPIRAKELVYQLGDEEDRSEDKTSWKWGLNSDATPIYLERRNQCRRSEIRNRTKIKRKTKTNSSFMSSFVEPYPNKESKSPVHSISRNDHSIDDNGLSFEHLKNKSRNEVALELSCTDHSSKSEEYNCNHNLNLKCGPVKLPSFMRKPLIERSKSVHGINYQSESWYKTSKSSNVSSNNLFFSESNRFLKVKHYDNKIMPKRIASLKKQRSGKKETSTFYMDLSEFEDTEQTVLRITESSENIWSKSEYNQERTRESQIGKQLPDVVEQNSNIKVNMKGSQTLNINKKSSQDAQIILDLLKNNKEFDKLYNKLQKKRSSHVVAKSINTNIKQPKDLPPRPPSSSPPPLELESDLPTTTTTQDCENDEHIYETLLRNVHVPYKFSPIFASVNPERHCREYKCEKKGAKVARPESDYVTLVFPSKQPLENVSNKEFLKHLMQLNCEDLQLVQQASSISSSAKSLGNDRQKTNILLQRTSEGNVEQQFSSSTPVVSGSSVVNESMTESICNRPIPWDPIERQNDDRSTSKNFLENVVSSENTLFSRGFKTTDSFSSSFVRPNKQEVCHPAILHLQGSKVVGERIANVDYADPKTIFSIFNKRKMSQHNSLLTLASSCESIYDNKQSDINLLHLQTNFDYENRAEECLENEFQDNLIYSEDCEKCVKMPSSLNSICMPSLGSIKSPTKQAMVCRPIVYNGRQTFGVIVCPSHLS